MDLKITLLPVSPKEAENMKLWASGESFIISKQDKHFFKDGCTLIVTSMLVCLCCKKACATSEAIRIFNSILAKIKDTSSCVKHLMSKFYFLALGK